MKIKTLPLRLRILVYIVAVCVLAAASIATIFPLSTPGERTYVLALVHLPVAALADDLPPPFRRAPYTIAVRGQAWQPAALLAAYRAQLPHVEAGVYRLAALASLTFLSAALALALVAEKRKAPARVRVGGAEIVTGDTLKTLLDRTPK